MIMKFFLHIYHPSESISISNNFFPAIPIGRVESVRRQMSRGLAVPLQEFL